MQATTIQPTAAINFSKERAPKPIKPAKVKAEKPKTGVALVLDKVFSQDRISPEFGNSAKDGNVGARIIAERDNRLTVCSMQDLLDLQVLNVAHLETKKIYDEKLVAHYEKVAQAKAANKPSDFDGPRADMVEPDPMVGFDLVAISYDGYTCNLLDKTGNDERSIIENYIVTPTKCSYLKLIRDGVISPA